MTAPKGTDSSTRRNAVRKRLASIEAAAIAGIVCAIGWVWGLQGLLAGPPAGASAADTAAYLNSADAHGALVQLQIVVVGTVGFLWFIGVIRARLGHDQPRLVTTVNLSGSILLAAFVLAGAAALATPRVLAEISGVAPDPGAAAMCRAAALVILGFLVPRMATIVVLSTAQLGRMTGALPRWLVWLSVIVGVGEFLIVTLWSPNLYTFPIWVAVVSAVLVVRRADRDSVNVQRN